MKKKSNESKKYSNTCPRLPKVISRYVIVIMIEWGWVGFGWVGFGCPL
jgi:hypothetical protein